MVPSRTVIAKVETSRRSSKLQRFVIMHAIFFVVTLLVSVALWANAELLYGANEPWDGNPCAYFLVAVIYGLVCGAFLGNWGLIYPVISVLAQCIYVDQQPGPKIFPGIIVIGIFYGIPSLFASALGVVVYHAMQLKSLQRK